jgi:hypothetical protein
MSSHINRPLNNVVDEPAVVSQTISYHDRIRWGPIISGLMITLATQLVLSALGAANGLSLIGSTGAPRSNAPSIGSGVGIWTILSVFISLFIGGWMTARASGPMKRSTALLNGAILWAATLALSSWLLASGVTGAFGVVASNAGAIADQVQRGAINLPNQVPNLSAQQARDIAANAARGFWLFVLASLLGLVASLVGAAIGVRNPRSIH